MKGMNVRTLVKAETKHKYQYYQLLNNIITI